MADPRLNLFKIEMIGSVPSQESLPQRNSSGEEFSRVELHPHQWNTKGMGMRQLCTWYVAPGYEFWLLYPLMCFTRFCDFYPLNDKDSITTLSRPKIKSQYHNRYIGTN